MYRADMIGIEIDGLPRSMYGDPYGAQRGGAAAAAGGAGPGAGGGATTAAGGGENSCRPGPSSSKPEAVGWGESFKNSKQYTVLKKVVRLLQDNRLNSGDEETEQKLRELNRAQNESYPILKTILNVIFITTGLVLLIGVVVVIIYTSIVKPEQPPKPGHSSSDKETSPGESSPVISSPSESESSHALPPLENLPQRNPPSSSVAQQPQDPDKTSSSGKGRPSHTHGSGGKAVESGTSQTRPKETHPGGTSGGSKSGSGTPHESRTINGQRVETEYKCSVQPIVHDGRTVKLGRLCFHTPVSEQHPSNGRDQDGGGLSKDDKDDDDDGGRSRQNSNGDLFVSENATTPRSGAAT